MSSTRRTAFEETIERLFDMARDNIQQDGFTTEMLLGFDRDGQPSATFVGAGEMNPQRLGALMPSGVRVVARPLVTADTLLAAGLALSHVQAAIYVGVLDIAGEDHLVAAGVYPSQIQVVSFAVSLDRVHSDRAVTTSTEHSCEVTRDMVLVENWLISLLPDEVEDWTSETITAILAS